MLMAAENSVRVSLSINSIDSAKWGNVYAEFRDEKPKAEWKMDGLLTVRALRQVTGSTRIKKEGARIYLEGERLILCYKSELSHEAVAPVASYAFPIVLEFHVIGIHRRDYLITVSDDCDQL